MANLKLIFSFTIGGEDRTSHVETHIERKLAIISFALPYELDIVIPGAKLIKREYLKQNTIYIFEFAELDAAMEFMDEPAAHVDNKNKNANPKQLEEEMNSYMWDYDETKKKSKKKRLVEDENGFTYYE